MRAKLTLMRGMTLRTSMMMIMMMSKVTMMATTMMGRVLLARVWTTVMMTRKESLGHQHQTVKVRKYSGRVLSLSYVYFATLAYNKSIGISYTDDEDNHTRGRGRGVKRPRPDQTRGKDYALQAGSGRNTVAGRKAPPLPQQKKGKKGGKRIEIEYEEEREDVRQRH